MLAIFEGSLFVLNFISQIVWAIFNWLSKGQLPSLWISKSRGGIFDEDSLAHLRDKGLLWTVLQGGTLGDKKSVSSTWTGNGCTRGWKNSFYYCLHLALGLTVWSLLKMWHMWRRSKRLQKIRIMHCTVLHHRHARLVLVRDELHLRRENLWLLG